MATLAQLCISGQLVRYDPDPDQGLQPVRMFYGTPGIFQWVEDELPSIASANGAILTPEEQLYELLERFVGGRPLIHTRQFRHVYPKEDYLWELKTQDLRIFGWFPKFDVFVAVRIDSMANVKKYDLDHGYINETKRYRDLLDLDPPKVCEGSYADVISI